MNKNGVSTTGESKIDLKKIWKILTGNFLIRKPSDNKLLSDFATLLATKSSFAHKAHIEFKTLSEN